MRMPATFLVTLCILAPVDTVAGGVTPFVAHSESNISPRAASKASSIPTWRLSVRTFGQSSGYPVLGVYRRIGDRHDLGIAVSGRIDSKSGDRDRERWGYDDDSSWESWDWDSDEFDLSLHGELRRWTRVSDRVSCYGGARLTTRYYYDHDEDSVDSEEYDHLYGHLDSRKYETFGLGASLTIGADLELLRHLSVSASFLPISITQNWYKRTYENTDTRDTEESRAITTDRDRGLSLRFHPFAAAYLSVTF
jgi:hypothetical protein